MIIESILSNIFVKVSIGKTMLTLLLVIPLTSVSQPVVGNEGRVKKIYVAEFRSDIIDPAEKNDLVDTLEDKEIDVCLSRYILCYGSDVTTARVCFPDPADNFEGHTIDSSAIARISPLFPLYASGQFQRIDFSDGASFRFDTLSISEKLDVLPLMSQELYSLKWSNGRWTNDLFTVSALDSMGFAPKQDDLKLASFWWQSRDSARRERFTQDSTVYLDWEWICGSQPDPDCQTEVRQRLSRFSQDQFLVRSDNTGGSCLTALNRPYWGALLNRRMGCYASQLCGCAPRWDSCEQVNLDSLAIRGGNYFVRDSVVFIGSDVASYYRYCQNWWSSLGFNSRPSMDSLEHALGNLIIGKPQSKVVWVGDGSPDVITPFDCNRQPPESSVTQPIYHIDLFFHPLGTMRGGNDFYYVIALLTDSLHSDSTTNRGDYKDVKRRLTATADSLRIRLHSLGFEPCPIVVPLVFYGGSDMGSAYIAFANGISEKTDSGFRYLMPDYLNSGSFKYEKQYQTTRSVAENALKAAKVDVVRITANYGMVSALNCMTKVLIRLE